MVKLTPNIKNWQETFFFLLQKSPFTVILVAGSVSSEKMSIYARSTTLYQNIQSLQKDALYHCYSRFSLNEFDRRTFIQPVYLVILILRPGTK